MRAGLARATGSLVAWAAVVTLIIGGAFAAGSLARAAVTHAQATRLAKAAAHGFSETALKAVAAHDPNALAIANRFDPAPAVDSAEDQRIAEFEDRLKVREDAQLVRASLPKPAPLRPAPPFNLRGALDETRDLECLTQAVYYEARGESSAGQAAVAQVVLNRTRHPAFPKSVCGVVYQGASRGGCQFSFACDGAARRRVESSAWRRAEDVAARALNGFVMNQVGSATHFHVASLSPGWGPRLLRVAQVGAHVFYRFAGRGGSNLTETPAPSEPAPQVQPIYASLALTPLAESVASSVAGAAHAGAELVMGAAAAGKPASPKPTEAPKAAPAASEANAPAAAAATAEPTKAAATS